MIADFYQLTKPRMVYANVLVAVSAFIFASRHSVDWPVCGIMALGLAFVVAGACVFNNYADRNLDVAMERTKDRALPRGRIKPWQALVFGAALFAGGTLLLLQVGLLAAGSAVAGFIVYVFIYTPLKPRSPYALFPGAVAGAMPPVVGYAAAAHTLDIFAAAFFLFLFGWQIPHFLAIARFRWDEYSAARVPLWVKRPRGEQERRRARGIFYVSLAVILLFCVTLVLV